MINGVAQNTSTKNVDQDVPPMEPPACKFKWSQWRFEGINMYQATKKGGLSNRTHFFQVGIQAQDSNVFDSFAEISPQPCSLWVGNLMTPLS